VCEPIFARPFAEISFGQLLLRLFAVARRFSYEVQPQLVMLQKTLLNIEGLGRQLYPQLDLWTTAKPFLERWMEGQVGWRAFARSLEHEAPQWAKLVPQLPRLAHRLLSTDPAAAIERTLEAILAEERQRNRWLAALTVVAGALLGVVLVAFFAG
jgi:ubiquinone biosynthesis protein